MPKNEFPEELDRSLSYLATDGAAVRLNADDSTDTDAVYNIEETKYPVDPKPSVQPKCVSLTPEAKAEIVFNNFIMNGARVLSGKEKRALHRACVRNAKRGRYDYMFDPEKLRKREERDKMKFDKLNAPAKHTVDDIPADVQKNLLDMVNQEPWKQTAEK